MVNKKDINSLSTMLLSLKKDFGVTQTAIAMVLGVSAQALTDMKGGRRLFTPAMAEKLLEYYKNEPWAGWLTNELKRFAAPARQSILAPPDFEMVPVDTIDYLLNSDPIAHIPVVQTPLLGNRDVINERCERSVELPKWTKSLIPDASSPYILELGADDYAGHLQMGDYLLVVQTVVKNKEFMVVEHLGTLRLARNARYNIDSKRKATGWIALDSGITLEEAVPVATVMGIVMAKL